MKLIRCQECGQPLALLKRWANCDCGMSGGAYLADGDRCMIAGPCALFGISNRLFFGMRAEAWPYDEATTTRAGKPKVVRLAVNPGALPERVPA